MKTNQLLGIALILLGGGRLCLSRHHLHNPGEGPSISVPFR
jgi:hypothetical protein